MRWHSAASRPSDQNEGLVWVFGLCGQGVGTVILEGAAAFPAPVVSHLLGSSPLSSPLQPASGQEHQSVHGRGLCAPDWAPVSHQHRQQHLEFGHGAWDPAYCDSTGMSPLGFPPLPNLRALLGCQTNADSKRMGFHFKCESYLIHINLQLLS